MTNDKQREDKKVKKVFGSLECSQEIDGREVSFLTGANWFRVSQEDGKRYVVISVDELNYIAEFSKGFRIPQFYTQEEVESLLDKTRKEVVEEHIKYASVCPHCFDWMEQVELKNHNEIVEEFIYRCDTCDQIYRLIGLSNMEVDKLRQQYNN